MKIIESKKSSWSTWAKVENGVITKLEASSYNHGNYYVEMRPTGKMLSRSNFFDGSTYEYPEYERIEHKYEDEGYTKIGNVVFQARMKYEGVSGTQNSDHAAFVDCDNGIKIRISAMDFAELVKSVFNGDVALEGGVIRANWELVKKGQAFFIKYVNQEGINFA